MTLRTMPVRNHRSSHINAAIGRKVVGINIRFSSLVLCQYQAIGLRNFIAISHHHIVVLIHIDCHDRGSNRQRHHLLDAKIVISCRIRAKPVLVLILIHNFFHYVFLAFLYYQSRHPLPLLRLVISHKASRCKRCPQRFWLFRLLQKFPTFSAL